MSVKPMIRLTTPADTKKPKNMICRMVNGARKFVGRLYAKSRAHEWRKRRMKPIMDLHNIDVTECLDVLDTCEGNVYLVTNEGDRLNLKSKLCQLIGLTKLVEGGRIAVASIFCDNKDDESKLFRFNCFGETSVDQA